VVRSGCGNTVNSEQQSQADNLVAVVVRYQHVARALRAAQEDGAAHAELAVEQNQLAELLWQLLHPMLHSLARRWLGQHGMSGVEGQGYGAHTQLAFIGLGYICEKLPHARIDLEQNLMGYLWRIARNGMYDEFAPVAGQQALPIDAVREVADLTHGDLEERIVGTMYRSYWHAAVVAFWAEQLSALDQHILHERLVNEQSYEAIARSLGDYAAATVRQRAHRAIQKTRAHLMALEQRDDL
jgi:DNA-directed RNA polymerase specialized sigma24 family protein